MPKLDEISYSRDATIAAFRDYYQFLTKLYLPESAIDEPPPEGWPTTTTESKRDLGKTDEVIELLRHLPYIPQDNDYHMLQGAPYCRFHDWRSNSGLGEDIKVRTEDCAENVPAHVIGLTSGDGNDVTFLSTPSWASSTGPRCV